jgi:hypothetical protein
MRDEVVCNYLIGKYGWKTPFGRSNDRWEYNSVKLVLKDGVCWLVDRIPLTKGLVNTAMNIVDLVDIDRGKQVCRSVRSGCVEVNCVRLR